MVRQPYIPGENERINFILSLEEKYPVNVWTVNGIHIWPLIRTFLYVELWVEQQHKHAPIPPQSPSTHPTHIRHQGISMLKRIGFLWKYLLFLLTPLQKSRAVFASTSGYIDHYQGRTMHRFFDPLRITRKEYERAYIVFTGKKHVPGIKNQLQLGVFEYVQNLFARFYRRKGFVMSLNGFEAFCDDLRAHSPAGGRITTSFLQEAVTSIEKHAFIFKTILKKTNAREAIALCYYLDTREFFGMNLAAHRLGITSVDIQHGGQGQHHLAYGQFFKTPASGKYAILPSAFWCWDKASAASINTWASQAGVQHHAEVIDHPWLHYIQSATVQPAQAKPVIVYSLQPLKTLMLPQVISAMKHLGDECTWILRLHPNMHTRKDELRELVITEKIEAFIHPMTFNPVSLPETLAIASLHLTRTSGTAIEASLMGVPSLLLDKEGSAMFSALIEDGLAVDCSDTDGELLAGIMRDFMNKHSR